MIGPVNHHYNKYIDEYSKYHIARVGYFKKHFNGGKISYRGGTQLTFFNKESNIKKWRIFKKENPNILIDF